MARAAGISAAYLNLIEHNRRPVGARLVLRLAAALDVPPAELAEGREESELAALREAAVRLPVIANGDIVTEGDAAEALRLSGADGVMIGRGCYGRPWFPAQVAHHLRTGERAAEPPLSEQKAILLGHYRAMLDHFGENAGMRLARKHLSWYSRGLPGSTEFRAAVTRLDEVAAVAALIDAFFDPLIARGVARVPDPARDARAGTRDEAQAQARGEAMAA